ncbi:MAG: 30S ribosomal protein S16 [Bdellovibrionales bacterium]
MVVIRLSRVGSKNSPKYRVTVADSRKAVKGCFIDQIGSYDPLSQDKKAIIDKEKYEAWIKKGAKASSTVRSLFLKLTKGV